MSQTNPFQPPQIETFETPSITERQQEKLTGIGGWLILVAIGLVLSPIVACLAISLSYVPLFTSGEWEELTTPGSVYYHPLLKPLIIGEFLATILFLLGDLVLLYLFFSHKRLFPKLYITLALAYLLYVVIDVGSAMYIFSGTDEAFAGVQDLVGAIIGTSIWVPYMLVSKRVKNTFVK